MKFWDRAGRGRRALLGAAIAASLFLQASFAAATPHYDAEASYGVGGLWRLRVEQVEYEVSDAAVAEVVTGADGRAQVRFRHTGDVYVTAHIVDREYGAYDYTYLIHVIAGSKAAVVRESESAAREEFAREVLELVNAERQKAGRKPLRLADDLLRAADVRARELPQQFSHTRPDGRDFYTVLGEKALYYLGENIAAGTRTPQEVVDVWMHSEGHRKNILEPKYKELGVGYCFADGSEYGHYWVQIFRR